MAANSLPEWDDLDVFSNEVREQLDDWLVLHQLHLSGQLVAPIACEDRRRRIELLQASGYVETCRVRKWFLSSRSIYRLSPSGQRRLRCKREQVERIHAEVGGAIASAAPALAKRGIMPAVLMLERMILLHGRFDEERSGFFARCTGLA
ncbi:MAG: hypothetical protein ACI841_004918, partial [Planctomycetota bacterium]